MSANSCQPIDRVVTASGSFNLRDLGGLSLPNGRSVRRGRIYRGDYPGFVVDDQSVVQALGLRTVVDLRRSIEIDFECVPWASYGVDHVVCSFSAGKENSWHAGYSAYLTHRPEAVVAAVRAVMAAGGHPVLFHCAAGKDRTGVVAALLLSLLGVEVDQIVADYVLSDTAVPHVLDRLRTSGPYAAMLAETTYEDQRPRPEAMRAFLTWLGLAGGAEGWLRNNDVPMAEIDAYRRELVHS